MNTRETVSESEKQIIQYVISGKQVNINTGNGMVNASQSNDKQIREKQIVIVNNNYQQKSYNTKASRTSGNEGIFLIGVALLFALSTYVQYYWQIRLGVVVASFIIEFLTCLVYYKGKKNRISYDRNLKQIAVFNIVSLIFVPIMIAVISSSIYNSSIDFDFLQKQIINKGVIYTYFTVSEGWYVTLQMAGMFLVIMFLICIVISDLYIIAVLNIAMEKKGKRFWIWLLRRTCGKPKDGREYIKTSVIFMIISAIMIMGILPYILNFIQK